jgi:CheY-like chemotaxis protein
MPILTAVSSVNPRSLSAEELDDIFETIHRNVELEARLIDDLLDLTRIAKGKLGLDLRRVDAHQALRHALATCETEIAAKRLTLNLDLDAKHHIVKADPARLQQVFWNLLKNAVKFTPIDGALWIVSREHGHGQFELEVRDTGCGISREMLPKIFDAFEQGGAQTTRRFGGLGLGLAISRALIEAHEGEIRAESDGDGQGSRFIVTLPLRRDLPDDSGASRQPGVKADGADGAIAGGHRLILLVEDHADSARFLGRILERRGYRVVIAGSLADAHAAFERDEFDVIVSDIGLPDGDGLTLMEALRQKRPALQGIALSGYGMEHDHARSRAAGFGEHLTKPIDWPQLEAALKRLDARRGDGAA